MLEELKDKLFFPETLKDLPKSLEGIDSIETLIIDDGSTDRTVEVAKKHGAHHVLSLTNNKGLAQAFYFGLNQALKLGADIIVNTDADNQYNADDIEKIVRPIVDNRAEIVIGTRPISQTEHFSYLKIIQVRQLKK